MKKILTKTSLAAIAALVATSTAYAAEGMYLGAGLGASKTRMTQQIQYQDGSSASNSATADGVGLKIFGGYRFSPNFGAELQYASPASVNLVRAAGTGSADAIKRVALSISAIGYVPLHDNIDLLGKVGLVRTFHGGSNGMLPEVYRSGQNGLLLGIGTEYKLTARLALRVEVEHMLLRKPANNIATVKFADTMAGMGMRYIF